jgi:hypothetical protein
LKLLQEWGGIKENDGGVNLTKIYHKHFVNVTMYPPV